MVFYIYSLKSKRDDIEELLLCLTEKQNEFCKKTLISKKDKTFKLVINVGFNCPIEWNYCDILDIKATCISHENIDLKNIINNMHYSKTAIKSIEMLMNNSK